MEVEWRGLLVSSMQLGPIRGDGDVSEVKPHHDILEIRCCSIKPWIGSSSRVGRLPVLGSVRNQHCIDDGLILGNKAEYLADALLDLLCEISGFPTDADPVTR